MSKSSFSNFYNSYVSGRKFKDDGHFTKISDAARSSGKLKKDEILMYEPQHSIRMYYSSVAILIAAIFCYLYFSPFCRELTGSFIIVGLTSINHWRHPVFGIRRNVDLMCAQSSILYHLYCAYYEFDSKVEYTGTIYFSAFFINIIPLYVSAMYNGINHNHDVSSKSHAAMHVCGIFWNIFLYAGLTSVRSK